MCLSMHACVTVSDCFLILCYTSQYIFCNGWVPGRTPAGWWGGVNQSWFGFLPQKCHLVLPNENPTNSIQRQSHHTPYIFRTATVSPCPFKTDSSRLLVVPLYIPPMDLLQYNVISFPLAPQIGLSEYFDWIKSPDGYSQREWEGKPQE